MGRGFIRRNAIPFVGMVFFWKYFKHQGFFGVLFPLDMTIDVFGESVSGYASLLAILLLSALAAFLLARRLFPVLLAHRGIVLVLTALGSVGAAAGTLQEINSLGGGMFWVCTLCVSVGFIAGYLAWATRFSLAFNSQNLVMLSASYLVGLAFFGFIRPLSFIGELSVVLTPFIVGLAWWLDMERFPLCEPDETSEHAVCSPPADAQGAARYAPADKPSEADAQSAPTPAGRNRVAAFLANIGPIIGLLIAFLLAGSVIRGIVDVEYRFTDGSFLRLMVSLAMSLCVLVACLRFRKRDRDADLCVDAQPSLAAFQRTERLVVLCWVFLALAFFAGIFMSLLVGTYAIGGHIVVAARSLLDFLLWVLLCNLTFNKRIAPLPLFMFCGIFTELVSRFVSYVVMPGVLSVNTDMHLAASDTLVLVIVFSLLALITIVFGVVILGRQPLAGTQEGSAAAATRATTDASGAPALALPDKMIADFKLTSREAEVSLLFARGHSLRKVAEMLFISTSTAQSHIKSAYRKLDVHSKDELKDLIDSYHA